MKKKYDLTADLIRLENEPASADVKKQPHKVEKNARLNMTISQDLKTKMKLYGIQTGKSMTDIVEEALLSFLDANT